ncbi:Protein disulfide isomerase-like 2-1 [Durusdinium trenchii]|uniref:Protein disulfide isomerase-like 2-1 n=1 Tax=Durusdinium trenchii TaxID=1381693 RepID=A0ABP0NMM0_9DINO
MGCSLAFGLLRDLRISCGSLRAARNAFQSGSSASLVGESFLSLVVEPHRSRFQRLCGWAESSLRQGACAAVDVPSDGHPFAVEDVQDSPLHVPADASESLCYTRSDMEPADERATCGTQSEAAPGAEKCVGTAIVWREDRFRCSNCSRPPWPPDELLWEDAQRHTRHHERRRSGHEMLESLTGTWTVNPQFEHIAQPFIKHLTFRHGKCIDAFGQKRKVTEAGDHVFLLNGRIWLHNGVLFREGRSGIVMHFHRTDWPEADKDEDGEAIFDEDEDPNSLDLLQEMVFAHDAPLLS